MWIYLSIISAVLLGIYDFAKKQAVSRNSVMRVLFVTTALTALLLLPCYEKGSTEDFLMILPKVILVGLSWISGLQGMKLLPLTTSSTIKASRPVFVVLFSIILFGERLNDGQWAGVLLSLSALWLLGRSSRKEGIIFGKDKGVWWMVVSVITGVASALYDKHIMHGLSPDFVQSWSTLGIALFYGVMLLFQEMGSKERVPFVWDWNIVVVSVSILLADMAYFHALKDPDALLSIVSLMRRGCAIVAFALSVIILKEKNAASKALDLGLLMAGMTIMAVAS